MRPLDAPELRDFELRSYGGREPESERLDGAGSGRTAGSTVGERSVLGVVFNRGPCSNQ